MIDDLILDTGILFIVRNDVTSSRRMHRGAWEFWHRRSSFHLRVFFRFRDTQCITAVQMFLTQDHVLEVLTCGVCKGLTKIERAGNPFLGEKICFTSGDLRAQSLDASRNQKRSDKKFSILYS